MYVKSMELNGQDALSHYMELSNIGGGGMKIILHPGAGSVTFSQGPSSTASDVVLIPDVWTDGNLTPVVHLASKDHAFLASGLTPGGYTAVATVTLDAQTWADGGFVQEMRSRGTSFLVSENEQKAISAAEVGRDEINRIELRLGIY
jgi:hypothetical protein